MDYTEFQTQWAKCLGSGDYEQAFATLDPLLAPDSDHQGFALGLKGLGLHIATPRRTNESLRLTQEALPLVAGDLSLTAKTLIDGLEFASYLSDREASKTFSLHLRGLMMNPAFADCAWAGRCLVALGLHYERIEQYDNAARYYDEARQWHLSNLGPYGLESDRLCYLSVATACQAELRLVHNVASGPLVTLERAVRLIRTSKRAYLADYLEGLAGHRLGDFEEAVASYAVALEGAVAYRDHNYRLKVAIAQATVYRDLGRYADVRALLHPLIRECALSRMVVLVSRLQRFLQTLPREEVLAL